MIHQTSKLDKLDKKNTKADIVLPIKTTTARYSISYSVDSSVHGSEDQ